MNASSPVAAIGIVFAAFLVLLVALGAPSSRPPAKPVPAHHDIPVPPPVSVSGGGLTLASLDIALPDDSGVYPDGPHADVINANCTACHSAAMALYQPPLSADEWHKEVEKMRNTFKATVAEKDVPAIVEYLAAMSAKTAAANGDAPPAQ